MPSHGSIHATNTTQQDIETEFEILDIFDTNGPSQGPITTDANNNKISISNAGTYDVSFNISFKGTNERIYTISLFINGVQNVQEITAKRYISQNLTYASTAARGLVTIPAGGTDLDLRVKCNKQGANVAEEVFCSLVVVVV